MEIINQNKISAYWARNNTQKAIDEFCATETFAGIMAEVYGCVRSAASRGEGATQIDFSRYIKKAKISPSLVASALGLELMKNDYKVDFRSPRRGQFLLLLFWGVPSDEDNKGDLDE